MSEYRVVGGPLYSQAHLGRARIYHTIEDAVAVMGEGVVVRDRIEIVAFHQSHLPIMERLAAPPTNGEAMSTTDSTTEDSLSRVGREAYEQAVAHTARRLRDMADAVERVGMQVGTGPSPAGTSRYAYAANRVVHEVMWGMANANVDAVVSAAGMADRFDAEHGGK